MIILEAKIKIRCLGTVRSLFFTKIPAQLEKNWKKKPKEKKRKGHYFYKESMKNFSSGGNTDLFLTREQKIVAMKGFLCFTRLDTHFQIRLFLK